MYEQLLKISRCPRQEKSWIIGGLLIALILGIVLWIKLQPSSDTHAFVYLKSPCPDFVGRERHLKQLYHDLVVSSSNSSHRIKVLWGKGGYGKTELAFAFGNRYIESFSFIWTFYCDNSESLKQGYRELANHLGILHPADSFAELKEKVHFHLENQNFKRPWLLIYDNAEDASLEFPQRGGAVLITSQKKILSPALILEVPPLSNEESLQLLENITQEKRTESMENLAQNLEGIPLLINYAAHYIRMTPGASITEHSQMFSSQILGPVKFLQLEQDVNRRYLKSLTSSWQLTLNYLQKENPRALQFLSACSYLYPENIQEGWIEDWLKQSFANTGDFSTLSNKIKNDILKALHNYGIINYQKKSKTFSIHRFFQYMVRENRQEHIEEDMKQGVLLLLSHAKDYSFFQPSSWELGKNWYLHTYELKRWIHQYPSLLQDVSSKSKLATLYEEFAARSYFNYQYHEAIQTYQEILQLNKSYLGEDSPILARSYSEMGWCLFQLGRTREALQHFSLAEGLLKGSVYETAHEAASMFNSKGMTFYWLGEYQEALKCFQKALEINEKIGKREDIYEACYRANMSMTLLNLGLYQESRASYDLTLKIKEKTCGKKHPYYLWSSIGRACCFIFEGYPNKALKLMERHLALYQSLNGQEHGELGLVWNRFGICYLSLRNTKKAKMAFKKARMFGLKFFGKESNIPSIANLGLGWCYLQEKKVNKGLRYFLKYIVRSSKQEILTERMTFILKDFRSALELAVLFEGKTPKILKAAQIAGKISEQSLGKEHPLSCFFMGNLTEQSLPKVRSSISPLMLSLL